jgi:hypothetical protein
VVQGTNSNGVLFLQLYTSLQLFIFSVCSLLPFVASYLRAKTHASEIIIRARNYSLFSNKNYNGTNSDAGKKVLVHE